MTELMDVYIRMAENLRQGLSIAIEILSLSAPQTDQKSFINHRDIERIRILSSEILFVVGKITEMRNLTKKTEGE